MAKIKPCKFCGARELLRTGNSLFSGVELIDQDGIAWVQCGTCSAEGPTAETAEEAVMRWNASSEMDDLRKRLLSDAAMDDALAAFAFAAASKDKSTMNGLRLAIEAALNSIE